MIVEQTTIGRTLLIRLNPGDDILLSLRQAVQENNIQTGIILNGLGSLSSYHTHVVADTNLPPENTFVRSAAAYDILSITGVIIDGRVHAHIVLSDQEKAMGGHMEEGCQVLTFAMIMLAETPGASMTDWDSV